MKTVVLVEILDPSGGPPREAVMAVINLDAAAQINSNMARAKAYVRELAAQGLKGQSALVGSILDSVEEQLMLELRMTLEAQEIDKAASFYADMNREMAGELWA